MFHYNIIDMKKNKFYITTPLYYPNDNLHIGHAYTTVIADVLARYKKNNGFDVKFLTGSDEHGEKIEKKAINNKVDPLEFVTNIINNFKNLWKELDIEYDEFIRTTNNPHEKNVQNLFDKLKSNGDIYEGQYEGYYCSSCESYFTETQIEEGKCPDCGKEVYKLKQDTYFLKVKKEHKFIKDLVQKEGFIMPKNRANELVASFIDNDLKDLSITRDNFKWGIPVNKDDKKIIYVWFDALLGYLSGINYYNDNKYWDENTEIVQILGKEITRFHCIYWPIILKDMGARMPDTFLSHGWIVNEDGKMSKSKGNVVDPVKLIKTYGSDALRFFLMSQISIKSDGVYSEDKLKQTLNTYLANQYGNLISRTIQMTLNSFDVVPQKTIDTHESKELNKTMQSLIDSYKKEMDQYQINNAINICIELLGELNKYIDITEPWTLKENKDKLSTILNDLFKGINNITIMLNPFIPKGTKEAFKILSLKEDFKLTNLNKDLKDNKITKHNIYQRIK